MKFLLLTIILAATPTLAHDMSDPDAEWYRGLTVPGTNLPCCSGPGMSEDVDCRNVEVRQARDADGSVYWEAFADSKLFPESKKSPNYGFAPDAWVRVPEEAIVRGKTNPTARPVGCWYAKAWRCFVEGAGT